MKKTHLVILVFTWPVCFLTSLVITRGAQEEKKKKMCNNRIGAPYFPTREESVLMRLAWEIRPDSQKTHKQNCIFDGFAMCLFYYYYHSPLVQSQKWEFVIPHLPMKIDNGRTLKWILFRNVSLDQKQWDTRSMSDN